MPSGFSITAEYACFRKNDCYLNVHVYPLPEDFGNSEGLCGNYNGDKTDDRTVKGTNRRDDGEEPVHYVNSYR